MDVLRVGGVQPQRHSLARLRDRVQVDARNDVADGERDRLGAEHDGVRRSLRRSASAPGTARRKRRNAPGRAPASEMKSGPVTATVLASSLDVSLLTHPNVCQNTDMSQGEPGIELDTSLGYMLKAAASALHSALEAVLRPLGMTITHYACLELLAQRPGLSNSELARGAFVTRQSMNVLLQALEHQGLVIRPARAPVGRALPTGADRPRAPPAQGGQRRGSPRRARHAGQSGCQRTTSDAAPAHRLHRLTDRTARIGDMTPADRPPASGHVAQAAPSAARRCRCGPPSTGRSRPARQRFDLGDDPN